MFTDSENQILFLSLKSLDWLPTRYINTQIVMDQITCDSILKAMPDARSTIAKLDKLSETEARQHFELLFRKRTARPGSQRPAQRLEKHL